MIPDLRLVADYFGKIADAESEAKDRESRRAALLDGLRKLAASTDPEAAHSDADGLLLAYINDSEVSAVFDAIKKYYA